MTVSDAVARQRAVELDDFGEVVDGVANALWRLTRGRDPQDDEILDSGERVLRDIANQLREPYYSRPSLQLGDAIYLADADGADHLASQRTAASEFFEQLSESLAQVRANANAEEAIALAEMFAVLGASAADARRRSRGFPDGSWTTG
jgi:hypothetical protein